ncbi:hypothetical protein HYV11_01530 [Candidatus Dependentiae bacterium]|nr:hypothetical protein [Candidatus Dependentiae bacterium]
MLKKRTFLRISIAVSCYLPNLFSNLTTLQHWDPSPYYAANNYLMPPNSYLVNMRKARKKDLKPNDKRHIGISISGFVQGACKAYDSFGCDAYQGYCGQDGTTQSSKEYQMGNFRGTINGLGVFLGNDPNGNSIWDSTLAYIATAGTPPVGITGATAPNVSIFSNPSDTRLLTNASINKTLLPSCLKDIAKVFAGTIDPQNDNSLFDCPQTTPLKSDSAFIFNTGSGTFCTGAYSSDCPFPTTTPSIFSEDMLAKDQVFFGAFSLPLDYKKFGLRAEIAGEITDSIGFTIQTGFVNIQQTTSGLISISDGNASITTTSDGVSSTSPNSNSLYEQLCRVTDDMSPPDTTAQGYFDEYFSNNSKEIFDSECGLHINTCNFDEYSIEDLRFILSFKHTYDLDRYTADDNDPDNWSDMLFTPYTWIGTSIPISKKQNYKKLLSLPFGNNGHYSVGGAVGFMFDFLDSVEVGFEGGGTYFFEHSMHRPVPNHPLQRVVYPYSTDVRLQPGFNWHFKANINAYQFMDHISFWASYELIEHKKDHYCLCNNSNNMVTKTLKSIAQTTSDTACTSDTAIILGTKTEKIFYPELLNCNSAWRSQFINLALVFDIQPGMQASFLWQQPISPKNAYYPVSIMGTFTFMF